MATKCATGLFLDWNKNSVRYCSFKSNEHLEEGLDGKTDLDILVDKADYEVAKAVMKNNNYVQVEPVDVGAYPNVVNWFGMDYETGVLIHIHLHFEIMTGKSLYKDYCLPWKQLFLNNAFLDKQYYVKRANTYEEYVLLCTRMIVKRNTAPNNNNIVADIVKELNFLKVNINKATLEKTVVEMYGEQDSGYITDCMFRIQQLSRNEFIDFYNFIKKKVKQYQRSNEYAALYKSYRNRTNRMVSRNLNKQLDTAIPLKKRFTNGGITVAFVGIDGSGKSTVISIIKKWLNVEFDVKQYYAGAGDGKKTLVSSIALSTYGRYRSRKKKATAIIDAGKTINKIGFRNKIKGIGSAIAYLSILSSNIKHLHEAQILASKGVVCLMDRYPQNSLPFVHDGAKVKKYDTGHGILHSFSVREQFLLNKVKDYPFDIVFRLMVDPEVSYKRKPEESLEGLKYKAETLNKVRLEAKNVMNIDANQPLDNVVLIIKRKIWNMLVSN